LEADPALGYKRIVTTREGVVRPPFFRQRLSRFQAVVGITAGLLSIAGMVYSTTRHYVRTPVPQGDIVAIVQEASSGRPVLDATVEIYTLQNRLVTTLSPKQEGRARQGVNEGPYNLRISHPRFASQTKQVQVQPGQTSEVHIAMVRPAPPPPPPAAKPVPDKKITERKVTAAKVTPEKKTVMQEKKTPMPEKKTPLPEKKTVTAERKAVTPEKRKVAPAPKESGVRKPARNPSLDQVQTN
jgi:Carboxypeptidase regulatory-like domain